MKEKIIEKMHQGAHLSIIPLEIYNTLHNAAASYCSINAMLEPLFFVFLLLQSTTLTFNSTGSVNLRELL